MAANIKNIDLAKREGVELLIAALKTAIRGSESTRVGEIFEKYFDGGPRRLGTAISVWLRGTGEVRQQLLAADTGTKVSDYLLLKLSALSKPHKYQVLASCGDV